MAEALNGKHQQVSGCCIVTVRQRGPLLSGRADQLWRECREILYAGNSVTAQRDGYTESFHTRICSSTSKQYSASKLGLGGVGSMGLASYWHELAKDKKPSLCFIETTTADVGKATPLGDIESALVHILYPLKVDGVETCLVHLPRNDDFSHRRELVIAAYEDVAACFGVNSVQIDFTKDAPATRELLYDGVHTTPLGARHIGHALAETLLNLPVSTVVSSGDCNSQAMSDSQLRVDRWDRLRFREDPPRGRFKLLVDFVSLEKPNVARWSPEQSSEVLIGLQIVLGPLTAVIEIRNHQRSTTIQTWEPTCDRQPRLSYLSIPEDMRSSPWIEVRVQDASSAPNDLTGMPNHHMHEGNSMRIVGVVSQVGHSGKR